MLYNGYRGLIPQQYSGRGVKITHVHRLPKLRRVELYLHSPVRLRGVVLDKTSTGITLHLALLRFYFQHTMGDKSRQTGDLVEPTETFFRKVAYSMHDVHSRML
jgi:hypothetical protein